MSRPWWRRASEAYLRRLYGDSDYDGASLFVRAHENNFEEANRGAADINYIVIHVTDGEVMRAPINTFQAANPKLGHRSAHYVIGQDGEIIQCVKEKDVAWHAGPINDQSIGIEHVANPRNLMPSSVQYAASAILVRHLCQKYGIRIDRQSILGHSEADPEGGHTTCPNSVWQWGTYMASVHQPESHGTP